MTKQTSKQVAKRVFSEANGLVCAAFTNKREAEAYFNACVASMRLHRGDVYIMRSINGESVPLRLENQRSFREWSGCFSAI